LKRVFVSDCEGPISKNDNAFEIAAHFVPEGDRLFALISKYDDVLSDVVRKAGYNAGDTLKLILPFLKAYEVTDRDMRSFSAQNLILIANSKVTLRHIRETTDAFIVSTSYEHYIRALCESLSFPFENTFCTRLSIDNYRLLEDEKAKLRDIAEEIVQRPMIEIPPLARSISDFSRCDQETMRRLDQIFWSEIKMMSTNSILSEVTPIGGTQKAEAVKTVAKKSGVKLADVMYVGDSITDVEAFRLVRDHGGLTMSFNGNQYAVKNAEIAVMSENSLITALIAELFCRLTKQETKRFLSDWTNEALQSSTVDKSLLKEFFAIHSDALPKVQIVTSENMETLIQESCEFRKRVRGQAIGRLG
jgi:energy-converting hydrogenase A subunit R